MTIFELALLVIAFLSVLVAGAVALELFFGPDRDLEPNDDAPRMPKCGDPACRNPHPYRPWQERTR